MAISLAPKSIETVEDIDKIFLSYFMDELVQDGTSGIPEGSLLVGETKVHVLFYGSSLRVKKHQGTDFKSQYPGIYIQALEPMDDEEKPNYSQPSVVVSTDNKHVRVRGQEVWMRFQYQVTVASMSFAEQRRLSHLVHHRFPMIYGARSIVIGDTIREVRITDRNAEDILEQGIFKTNFTFQFSVPLFHDTGTVHDTVHTTELNLTNLDDESLESGVITHNN